MIRCIIAGGRDFDNYDLLKNTCCDLIGDRSVEIISGKAKGADTLGERFAEEFGIPIRSFPADWDLHGRSAGYIRNRHMAECSDILIAFWDGESRGTRCMIELARDYGLEINIKLYNK